jgi:poly(hydroxyalkanoate) depolymerase family esterase
LRPIRALVAFIRRLVSRAPRAQPGHFAPGKRHSLQGALSHFAFISPGREYLLYVPRGYRATRPAPLLVWIHGCRQTPEQFAAGTRVAQLADERGALVLLPRQSAIANFERCWNWFDPNTALGEGEAAIVAAQVEQVAGGYSVDRGRIYVAGLSSGGGLAVVLALRAPQLFAAVAIHSGVACGTAQSASSARHALRLGPRRNPVPIARDARAAVTHLSVLPVPALVIQGSADALVAPVHANYLVRQFLVFNGLAESALPPGHAMPEPVRSRSVRNAQGHPHSVRDFAVGGSTVVRQIEIEGLAHAWSGGEAAQGFFDQRAPDATQLIWQFLSEFEKQQGAPVTKAAAR